MNNCKNCNNQFDITKNRTIFCSRNCQKIFNIKPYWIQERPRPKKGFIVYCIVCNKDFYAKKYRIDKGQAKYCSRSCLAKVHLKKYILIHGFKSLNKPKHKYKTITIEGKSIRLHRYIMQQHLGRKLESYEHVHHINDDSSDNRIENLIVLTNSEHQKEEQKFRKKITSSSLES